LGELLFFLTKESLSSSISTAVSKVVPVLLVIVGDSRLNVSINLFSIDQNVFANMEGE
jgi:hypothetical protein